MFHIAIIDDDQSIHQKLEEMITSILFKYPIHFTVSHFFSGNEFLTSFLIPVSYTHLTLPTT